MVYHTIRRRRFVQTVGVSGAVLAGTGVTAAAETECGEPLEDPIPQSIKPASRKYGSNQLRPA